MKTIANVSAVVVNYNGKLFIEECLNSLLENERVCEVIVVDNGSTDGSRGYLIEAFPSVILIQSEDNLGFGRGCNLGAKCAQGEYLLLLNYDAVLHSGLGDAVEHLTEHRDTGLVGGRIVYPNGHPQPSVGRPFTPLRLVISWLSLSRWFPRNQWLGLEIHDLEWYLTPHKSVDWVTGALMLIRHSEWKKIGGMDPTFFLYVEDVDLCDRLRASGLHLDYLPSFVAEHRKGGGAGIVSPRALLSSLDSYNIYLSKHYNQFMVWATLLGISIVFFFRAIVMVCRIWRGSNAFNEARTYLRGAKRALLLSLGRRFSWGVPG